MRRKNRTQQIAVLLLNLMNPGKFYTKTSIIKLLKTNKEVKRIRVGEVTNAIQKLRKQNILSFDKATKFWTIKRTELSSKTKDDDTSIAIRLEKVVQKIASDQINMVATKVVNKLQGVMKQCVQAAIVELLSDEVRCKKVIQIATKQTVKDEFKLEVVPTLMTAMREQVETELIELNTQITKKIQTEYTPLFSRITKIENTVKSFKKILTVASTFINKKLIQ